MPIYTVPPQLERFVVARGSDRSWVVVAEDDHAFVIPCRDESQAKAICEQLNKNDHDGTVVVDLL